MPTEMRLLAVQIALQSAFVRMRATARLVWVGATRIQLQRIVMNAQHYVNALIKHIVPAV